VGRTMKLTVFLIYLAVCFSIFSCAHNPYDDFQTIQVGADKADVLDKIGSPLRSHFQNGKNIWTYRFYSKSEDALVYKDIILDSEKVLEIRNAKELDIKEIEKKEKLVETSIKESKAAKEQPVGSVKSNVDDSILTDTSKKKNDTFKPVE
jgi:hypothetical protein